MNLSILDNGTMVLGVSLHISSFFFQIFATVIISFRFFDHSFLLRLDGKSFALPRGSFYFHFEKSSEINEAG